MGTTSIVSRSSIEVVDALLACPRLDPNIGAYEYGWHGSHYRCSPVGLAMVESFDWDMAVGVRHADLVVHPRVLLSRLLQDPRVDLEYVAVEVGESCAPVRCSALDLVERSRDTKNYRLVSELLRAGAMLSSKWRHRLSRIP